MAKKRSVEKEEFWRLVLQEQSDSGLTIKAFCEQQGIASASFYAWKREVKLRDAKADSHDMDQTSRMIPVRIVNDQALRPTPVARRSEIPADGDTIEIASPAGFVFRCGSGVSPSRLGDLVAAVDQRGRRTC